MDHINAITPPKLWSFLIYQPGCASWGDYLAATADDPPETRLEPGQYERLCAELSAGNIHPILADQHYSECHPGGDDLIGIVDLVLARVREGCRVITWYGPRSEVLVAAINRADINRADINRADII